MKYSSLIFCLFAASTASAGDALYFPTDRDFGKSYDRSVEEQLLRHPKRLQQVVIHPSFRPEEAVYTFVSATGELRVAWTIAKGSIWSGASDPGRPSESKFAERGISEFTQKLDDRMGKLIESVWEKALTSRERAARPGGLDGTTHYFTDFKNGKPRTGYAWSPPDGSRRDQLVAFVRKLSEYAFESDLKEREAIRKAIIEKGEALLKRFE